MNIIDGFRRVASLYREAQKSAVPQVSDNHRKFLQHLDKSVDGVFMVARLFVLYGFDVFVSGIKRADSHDQWSQFADSGDLYVRRGEEEWRRIEVKRLGVSFSGEASWPFGGKFIVCAKHAWDNASPKAEAVVILSDAMDACAVVRGGNGAEKDWHVEKRADSRYSGKEALQEFYFCPKGMIEWGEVSHLGWQKVVDFVVSQPAQQQARMAV